MNYREESARKQAQEGNPFKKQDERQEAQKFKRCEKCGKKVGIPFRIYEDMYFCTDVCFKGYFGA
jgi:hypothetical protein